jgi:secondary thiamine-phosphate synthase enzyme
VISTRRLELDTAGNFSVVTITEDVRSIVRSTGIRVGQVLIFYLHTTGAVFITEHEAGIIADLQDMFERVAPVRHAYKHHLKEVDFNGYAHLRSALLGVSVTVPVSEGDLLLGSFLDIMVLDDQDEPAPRSVVVQVSGE